jgi:HAD superfamily hydrolase (TIGR01490 family)
MLDKAHKAFDVLPVRGRHAMTAARLEEKRELVDRAMGYVDLYGAYAECEAVYGLDRLLTLWDNLDDDDRTAFCFDPRIIDWDRYIPEVHLPSVVKAARAPMRPPSRGGQSRSERLRSQILSPDRQLAAFDLENTLIASNVVASYSWLASRHLDKRDRARFVLKTIAEAPRLLALDRLDRSDFLRYFYRRYDGAPVDQIAEDALEHVNELLLAKSFPAAIRRVREHRALGHRTVLITGALDFVVEPLRPLFDDVICARLGSDGVTYDGQLTSVPPTGEARYQALADLADEHGYDLRESIAYADSASDLPMLEAVGFPVAVNPETRLASIARKRGWLVEDFRKSPGMSRRLLPLAPPRTVVR